MHDFSGRTALVTGATHGIGLAIARTLAARGARVLVCSEDAAACRAVADDLGGAAMPADLSDRDETLRLAAAAGPIDHLIANAGMAGTLRAGDDGHEDEVARLFELNLHHARRLGERLIPAMAGRGAGSVVLTASLSSLRGNANIGAYSLTKAALAQLARDWAVRWGPHGVRVNAISPGLIATGWENAILSDPAAAERRMRMTPLRRIGQPHEVAALAAFLASDEAGFITGQNIAVDGGTSITDGN